MRKLLAAVATALLSCAVISAQTVGTGAYPFASFDTRGFDSVNIGNLNTRFNIPIVSKPGRGLPFNYSIQNEGLIWTPVTNTANSTVTWTPDPSWGFTGLLNGTAFTGYLTYTSENIVCAQSPNPTHIPNSIEVYNFGYVYHDPFGAAHPFNYSHRSVCSNGTGTATTTGNGLATDGSGYTLVNGASQVLTRTGTLISPAFSATASGASTSEVDSNGNTISFNGTSSFTDTTGSTPLTITGSNPVVFTYPSSHRQTIRPLPRQVFITSSTPYAPILAVLGSSNTAALLSPWWITSPWQTVLLIPSLTRGHKALATALSRRG